MPITSCSSGRWAARGCSGQPNVAAHQQRLDCSQEVSHAPASQQAGRCTPNEPRPRAAKRGQLLSARSVANFGNDRTTMNESCRATSLPAAPNDDGVDLSALLICSSRTCCRMSIGRRRRPNPFVLCSALCTLHSALCILRWPEQMRTARQLIELSALSAIDSWRRSLSLLLLPLLARIFHLSSLAWLLPLINPRLRKRAPPKLTTNFDSRYMLRDASASRVHQFLNQN